MLESCPSPGSPFKPQQRSVICVLPGAWFLQFPWPRWVTLVGKADLYQGRASATSFSCVKVFSMTEAATKLTLKSTGKHTS